MIGSVYIIILKFIANLIAQEYTGEALFTELEKLNLSWMNNMV